MLCILCIIFYELNSKGWGVTANFSPFHINRPFLCTVSGGNLAPALNPICLTSDEY